MVVVLLLLLFLACALPSSAVSSCSGICSHCEFAGSPGMKPRQRHRTGGSSTFSCDQTESVNAGGVRRQRALTSSCQALTWSCDGNKPPYLAAVACTGSALCCCLNYTHISHFLHLFVFASPHAQKFSLRHARQSPLRPCGAPSARWLQVCWAGVREGAGEHGHCGGWYLSMPCCNAPATARAFGSRRGSCACNLTAVPVDSEQRGSTVELGYLE